MLRESGVHASGGESFSQMNERFRSRLHAHCRRLLGSHEDAEDAVQETFLRAWRSREGRRSGTSTAAWLHRIATNVCFDALERRRKRRAAVDAVESAANVVPLDPSDAPSGEVLAAPGPAAEMTERETIELAYLTAIRHLPPRQQTVLILREVMGRSARETAELIGTSVASVNSAGQRARATMRRRLPERRLEWRVTGQPSPGERDLLGRYLEATERGDAECIAAVLGELGRCGAPAEMCKCALAA